MPDFDQIISIVAKSRTTHDAIKDAIKNRRAEFEASIAPLLAEAEVAANILNAAEQAARDAAIAVYEANPDDKKPHPALGIRVSKGYLYEDADATQWAIQHDMPALLKLDRKAFDKLLKDGVVDGLDVIEVTNVTATIATDLSAYLTETDDARPQNV